MIDVFADTATQLAAFQTELGAACPFITMRAVKYFIIPNAAMNNRPLRAGGIGYAFDLQLDFPIAQFIPSVAADPNCLSSFLANTPFLYLGQNYKVWMVHFLSGATVVRIGANALNEKA